ncbi:hypothetical protein LEMLEM_LOCUS11281 [Lemmus lemmus]
MPEGYIEVARRNPELQAWKVGAEETEAEQDQGKDAQGVGGGIEGRTREAEARRRRGAAAKPVAWSRSAVLQILPELRPRGSRVPAALHLKLQRQLFFEQSAACFKSDCTTTRTPSPRSENTPTSRTSAEKQPREAATPGWESRNQQVRRSCVTGRSAKAVAGARGES